ncbi:PLP-dependent transferase [Phellopilus nigrolimitatus]|nr:PLP-dependent transferase [Phellopilus nigrolimitatus]
MGNRLSTASDENAELWTSSSPTFGHAMLEQFSLDPSYINLNNGSYGSLPRVVQKACEKLSNEIESNPDRFLRLTFNPLLLNVRSRLEGHIGAETGECVMIPNTTHGINTVLRNIEWSGEDVIVATTVTYEAVSRTIQYISDSPPHPMKATFALNFPTTIPELIGQFRAHLKSIPRYPKRRVVAIIDSIVSKPGILLPWEEMVKICKEEGVVSVVDAAHSIGQQVNINIKESDPDFWVSSCHKWLFAKRGCAVLYVPKRNQTLIKTTLPTSFGYVSPTDPPGGPKAPNFVEQFQRVGTIDWVPYLSVSHALNFRQWIGGEKKINDYCHILALSGGRRLAEILGTRVMDEDGAFTANMVNVALPLKAKWSNELSLHIRNSLLEEWNMYAYNLYHNDSWWIRCSVQIYNELSDFEKLGKVLLEICQNLEEQREGLSI